MIAFELEKGMDYDYPGTQEIEIVSLEDPNRRVSVMVRVLLGLFNKKTNSIAIKRV